MSVEIVTAAIVFVAAAVGSAVVVWFSRFVQIVAVVSSEVESLDYLRYL